MKKKIQAKPEKKKKLINTIEAMSSTNIRTNSLQKESNFYKRAQKSIYKKLVKNKRKL